MFNFNPEAQRAFKRGIRFKIKMTSKDAIITCSTIGIKLIYESVQAFLDYNPRRGGRGGAKRVKTMCLWTIVLCHLLMKYCKVI